MFSFLFTLVVFSGGGLSVLEMCFYQLSVGVKASLVGSQHMSATFGSMASQRSRCFVTSSGLDALQVSHQEP